jgi:hypothetical protein
VKRLRPLLLVLTTGYILTFYLHFASNAWVYILTPPFSTVAFVIGVVKTLRKPSCS